MFSLDPLLVGASRLSIIVSIRAKLIKEALVDRATSTRVLSRIISELFMHFFKKNRCIYLLRLSETREPLLHSCIVLLLFDPDAPLSHHWSDATRNYWLSATLGG